MPVPYSAVRQLSEAGNSLTFVAIVMVPLAITLRTVIVIAILAAAQWPAPACAAEQARSMPTQPHLLSRPQTELETRLFAAISDGGFGRFSLLAAGLIAGGVERNDELRRYCGRFDRISETLRNSGKVRGSPREQARIVFEYLHRKLLGGGYCLDASDLRLAFDRGRFNCVTSALLFNCLARRFGLKAVGREMPGHALSRLVLPGETIDVETTCPRWIDEFGTPSVPHTRSLTDVELVATIYYNRGIDFLGERRFADAVAANVKAMRLDPHSATAKGNYFATINNWGIELASSGQYAKAAELFRYGMASEPGFKAFRSNYARLMRQWDATREDSLGSNRTAEP